MRKIAAYLAIGAALALAAPGQSAVAQEVKPGKAGQRDPNPIPAANSRQADWGAIWLQNRFVARNEGVLLLEDPILFARAYQGSLERAECAANVGGIDSFAPYFAGGARGEDLPYVIANRYRTCRARGTTGSYFLLAPAAAELLAKDRWPQVRTKVTPVSDDTALAFIGDQETEMGPLDRYSRCLVLVAPAAAFAVFRTPVGSEAERLALEEVARIASNCQEPGYGTYDTTATLRRASLGMAALAWTEFMGVQTPTVS